MGALTIGLEEAELVGGEATCRRHGGEGRRREGKGGRIDRNSRVTGTELLRPTWCVLPAGSQGGGSVKRSDRQDVR